MNIWEYSVKTFIVNWLSFAKHKNYVEKQKKQSY